MSRPPALLLLRPGPRIRPEWSADSLRERYQEALALTQAPAAFRPRDPKPGDPTPEFRRKPSTPGARPWRTSRNRP
ncbi:MAG: hypothetical protein R3E96_08775 [Planctomycetota bacterium]